VSYAWKEEREGDNARAVESFCQELTAAGVDVVRDSETLNLGECLSTFMWDVGASNFLCVFLSDSYLRSPNCMYELLVAWQRSRDNANEFRERVKIWVMPGLKDISDLENRAPYLAYWGTKESEKVR